MHAAVFASDGLQVLIAAVNALEDRIPACLFGVGAGGLAHRGVFRWVGEDGRDSCGEAVILNNAPGFAVAHDGLGAAAGVTMAGTPLARASSTTLPKVSVCEGKTKRSMLA